MNTESEVVYNVVRHKGSELEMIQSLAAETIQETYRRYKECQSSVRTARVRRENAQVEHLAADTIKEAIKDHVSRKKDNSTVTENNDANANAAIADIAANSIEQKEEAVAVVDIVVDEDDRLELPPGWERRFDDVKGRSYYVDHVNKKTQWKHPRSPCSNAARADSDSKPAHSHTGTKESSRSRKKKRESCENKAGACVVELVQSSPPKAESVAMAVVDEVEEAVAEGGGVSPGAVVNLTPAAEAPAVVTEDAVVCDNQAQAAVETAETVDDAPEEEAVVEVEEEEEAAVALPPVAPAASPDSGARSGSAKQSNHNLNRPSSFSNKKGYPSPPPTQHLVVDEAFSVAFQDQGLSVRFKPKEVVLLLDALDCDVPVAVLQSVDTLGASVPSVELPVLHAGPMASVLTTYVRNYGLVRDARSFTLPEEQAKVAVGRICGLISGLWSKDFPTQSSSSSSGDSADTETIRAQLLLNCDGSLGKSARPVYWSERQVCSVMGCCMRLDSGSGHEGGRQQMQGIGSGEDLLAFDLGRLEAVLGVSQSLLQTRFAVYQQVLQLLDKWWELGHRPGDVYRDVYRSAFLAPPPRAALQQQKQDSCCCRRRCSCCCRFLLPLWRCQRQQQ
jgi:hypothetical protein